MQVSGDMIFAFAIRRGHVTNVGLLGDEMRFHFAWLALEAVLLSKSCFGSVGFQRITIPDPHGKPIAVGIWYPSHAPSSPQPLGLFSQDVAVDGQIAGGRLPVVLVSHGAYGSSTSHYDTAIALAQAGFVVVALAHTGDHNDDQSFLGNRINVIDRPRQVKVVLDWIFSSWPSRSHFDQKRVGMFGFSLGGFTTLVEIG